MVLLIIIPMKNGYFIGNIPNIFRQTHIHTVNQRSQNVTACGFFSVPVGANRSATYQTIQRKQKRHVHYFGRILLSNILGVAVLLVYFWKYYTL